MSDDLISRRELLRAITEEIQKTGNEPITAEYILPSDGLMRALLLVRGAPTVPAEVVVHCENCQHIHVLNTSEIYAICDKTNFVFQPFGVDTREFGCLYGERRESEVEK